MSLEDTLTTAAPETSTVETTSTDTSVSTGAEETVDLGFEETSESTEQKTEETQRAEQTQPKEEPELAEFKGSVSARLRAMVKEAPELAAIFKAHPKVQEQWEAMARREAALRDAFPTVAEARFMRETFPNGQADVQELLSDVKDLQELDNSYDQRDAEGNYPGHAQLIKNFVERDKNAAISLFKTLPKEWAQIDRESYNEVMGKVVGATFAARQIPEFLTDLAAMAKEAEQPELEKGIGKLLAWVNGYLADKPKPTAEQEALQRDRAAFDRAKNETTKVERQRFDATFKTTNFKLQSDAVRAHPAIQKLLKLSNKTLSDTKKNEIVEKIRDGVQRFLSKSPSFMRKLRPLYEARDINEAVKLQKAMWAQPWLMNKFVRTVLRAEVPQLVSSNREAAKRNTATEQRRTVPVNASGKATPKGPRQIGGIWYKEDGTRFTTVEIMAGKHLAA